MTKNDFLQLANEMRIRQRFYFTHRFKEDLIASKRLERQFDDAIEQLSQYGFDD